MTEPERKKPDEPAGTDSTADLLASSAEASPPVDSESADPAKSTDVLSLDKLTSAFAEMLSGSEDSSRSQQQADPSEEQTDEIAAWDEDGEQDATEISPESILEAILFVGHPENRALSNQEIAAMMRGVSPREIDTLVKELNEKYESENRPYRVVSGDRGYQLSLRDEYSRIRDRFFGRRREATLSAAAIEVLAIVAYNQGSTSEQINTQRGTPSGSILTQLVRRKLLRLERDSEKPRKVQYYTTSRFLKLFRLQSIDELPKTQRFEPQ